MTLRSIADHCPVSAVSHRCVSVSAQQYSSWLPTYLGISIEDNGPLPMQKRKGLWQCWWRKLKWRKVSKSQCSRSICLCSSLRRMACGYLWPELVVSKGCRCGTLIIKMWKSNFSTLLGPTQDSIQKEVKRMCASYHLTIFWSNLWNHHHQVVQAGRGRYTTCLLKLWTSLRRNIHHILLYKAKWAVESCKTVNSQEFIWIIIIIVPDVFCGIYRMLSVFLNISVYGKETVRHGYSFICSSSPIYSL